MKNKKGFTLVELIGVIVLLSILTLLIVPQVKNIIEKQKKKLYDSQLKIVLNSARQYVTDQEADTDVSKLGLMINISDLYDKGYLNKDKIIDPTTGKNFDKCVEVRWDSENNQYNYVYDDDCQSGTHRGCFAFNKSTQTIDSYYDYEFNDNTKPACPRYVEIPRIMDDVEVKSIGGYAFKGKNITGVIFPDTLTKIGYQSFLNNSISELYIPDNITVISEFAFWNNNISIFNLPDTITVLGGCSFAHNQIKEITIPSKISTLGNEVFSYNLLTTVEIPNNITSIEWGAFKNNKIKNIKLSSNLQTIGDASFYMNQIEKVDFPETLVKIGGNSFYQNRLSSIIIPNSVTEIGISAFQKNLLSSVKLSDNTSIISQSSFADNYISSINIPQKVKSIKEGAFQNNKIKSLSLLSGLEEIGTNAFHYNEIENLNIPSTVNNLGALSFNNNQLPDSQAYIYKRNNDGSIDSTNLISFGGKNRKDITIPNGTKYIGEKVFFDFNNLGIEHVNISNGVVSIGSYAFGFNRINGDLILPNTLQIIADNAFTYNSIESVTIPNSVTNIGVNAFYTNAISTLNLSNNLSEITNNSFRNNRIENLTIPSSVKKIGNNAFSTNMISKLIIPNTVVSIESQAFNRNSLPNDQAFTYQRNDLNNDGIITDNEIDKSSLIGYGGLEKNYVVIPSNVVNIASCAFCETYVSNVTIPSGVVNIGENAFSLYYSHFNNINVINKEGKIIGAPWGANKAKINYYTPIDYIQGDGSSYIDTGFAANNNTSVEESISLNTLDSTQSLYCSRTATKTDRYCAFYIANSGIRTDYNIDAKTIFTTAALNTKYKIYQDKFNFSIDDNLLKTWPEGTFQASGNIYLFSSYATPYDTISNYGTFNLYYFKAWDNGSLVRDMIPVKKSDGTVGMFDRITGNIYTNAGSGSLIAGPEL